MEPHKTRLFVVVDPTASSQPALVKALLIAKLGNCHIHAFACIDKDIAGSVASASSGDSRQDSLAQANAWMEELMQPCKMSGVSFTTDIVRNRSWVESLVRAVEQSDCDLVIKSSYHHGKLRRFLSETSDYYLMRHCAPPILFTHQAQEWNSDRILACVDLESQDPAHTRLNNTILRDARALAEIIGMDLHIGCAFVDAINPEHLSLKSGHSRVTAERLGEHFDVPAERILLRHGSAVATLQAICEELDPCIVVIGTRARGGISARLIGNTAEKLLDLVNADLLTVY